MPNRWFGWVGFYDILTIVGYLMSNSLSLSLYIYIYIYTLSIKSVNRLKQNNPNGVLKTRLIDICKHI